MVLDRASPPPGRVADQRVPRSDGGRLLAERGLGITLVEALFSDNRTVRFRVLSRDPAAVQAVGGEAMPEHETAVERWLTARSGVRCFPDDVQILAHEPLLQFNQGARVGQADQLLRGPQVGSHDALDETFHALLHVLQAAVGGVGSTISVRTVARVLGPVQHAGTAFLELLAAFTAAEPAVALGRALRPSQPLNCSSGTAFPFPAPGQKAQDPAGGRLSQPDIPPLAPALTEPVVAHPQVNIC